MTTTHAGSTSVRYLVVWLALVALTGVSFLFSLAHLGAVDVVVALLIATIKTCLVVLVFMHLSGERFSVVMFPLAAVFFVGLLVSLVVVDVATRHTFPRAPTPDLDDPPALAD
jgi:cytochrome c oxidase subunit 4